MNRRIRKEAFMAALGIVTIPTTLIAGISTMNPFVISGSLIGAGSALHLIDAKMNSRVFSKTVEDLKAAVKERDELILKFSKNKNQRETLKPQIDKLTKRQQALGKDVLKMIRNPKYRKVFDSLEPKLSKEIETIAREAANGNLTTDKPV